jgi:serine protease Do
MRALSLLLAFSFLASAQSSLKALSSQFQTLVEKTDPAVVEILVRSFTSDDEEARLIRTAKGNGSGVIVSADGYIVTNAHVIANARRIQVHVPQTAEENRRHLSILKSAGKLVSATLVGQDRETDIAVLKIEEKNLPFLEFGDSESLRQGQLVFAFGSPLGLANSVTMGIVSSVARQVRPDDPMIYLQTDASINPGNSGGPLVDSDGKLVGINTFILTQSGGSEGIGFAAPSNIVRTVFQQIRERGHVRRGQIGVLTSTISPLLAQALSLPRDSGVLIEDVMPSSAAAAAGLQLNDIVLSLNGKHIENARQFGVNIYQNAGKTVDLEILRGTETKKVAVAVLDRPADPDRLITMLQGDSSRIPKIGALAVDLNEKTIPLFPGVRLFTGAVIAGITADLAAGELHLAPGDIIHKVGSTQVLNLEGLRKAVEPLTHGQVVALQIERQERLMYLLLEID